MIVRTLAPAKINWTLEVLGRRDDGYHEIRSVMQTIELCDGVEISLAPWFRQGAGAPSELSPGEVALRPLPISVSWAGDADITRDDGLLPGTDLAFRAADLLNPEGSRDAHISLTKVIPVAAGLGGGSSDAAAVLRGLDQLWGLGWDRERLAQVAAKIGADVTFFLSGGTALAEGRGERITPLPDAPSAWLVLLAPPIRMPDKTKRMYEALKAEEFTDGQRTEALAERLRQGKSLRGEDLYNVFERAAYEAFEGLDGYRRALLEAGAGSVHLAGAGPTLFSVVGSRREAEAMAAPLRRTDAKVFVARTLGAGEATGVVVSE